VWSAQASQSCANDGSVGEWPSRGREVLTGPICAQAMRGSGDPFPWVSAQTERVQDWPSLDRHEDIRVNLAAHAANTTCPLLANPKISGCTLRPAGIRL